MSAPTESGFIHRELGKIVATLQAMKEDQEEFRKETKEHRVEVNTQLGDMYARIARLEEVTKLSAASLTNDVLPTVNKVKTWEQRGIGFLAFAGMAGTGFGAAMMKYGSEIMAFAASIFKG